jgi:hypothetical protein
MGTYYSTFIGVYIKVPNKLVDVPDNHYLTPDGNKSRTKFNPETGEPYTFVPGTKKERIFVDMYMDGIENLPDGLERGTFNSPEYAGASDNYTIGFASGFDKEYDFNESLNDVNIIEELSKFRIRYAAYISYFEEKYGECQVHYGVVHHGS